MFVNIKPYLDRPDLNDPGNSSLYRSLWEDEHISKGMLASHLNPDEEGATCRHAFVFRSARWIAEIAPPAQFGKLLDLGCGPGIYAERFANEGYAVTGIDYAGRSIAYARQQAERSGSAITYVYQNYLTMQYREQFDVITLINKDYAVFSAGDRAALLERVYRALKPGGKFIFDVMTPVRRKEENRTWQYCANGSFYAQGPHLLLESVYQYDDADETEIHRYLVVKDDTVSCYLCPNHYFTKEKLLAEVLPAGFRTSAFYGDIAGKADADAGECICGVFTK